MKKRLHVKVFGDVHGVFYRASTRDKAVELGLTGYVQNMPDSTVEAVFEGEESDLTAMLEFCKEGPSTAAVNRVEEAWQPFQNEFKDFKVRYW